jgi:hypothetical protein
MYNTDHYESLRKAQFEANQLFERLLEGPPTAEEIALQTRYPNTPRTQILRMLVRQRLSA